MNGKSKLRVRKRRLAVAVACVVALVLTAVLATGCGSSSSQSSANSTKSMVYGTTAYNTENEDAGLDPHSSYMGWSCVRYGVGETLFKFDDNMEIQPWLAESYSFTDDTTVQIKLRDNVTFSNGDKMDGAAVKACLDDLVSRHDRAPSDLKIASIEADGQTVTIKTTAPNPAIMYYLSDPYGAIIDMAAGVTADHNVVGTGPYTAQSVSDTEVDLVKNASYWGGAVNVDNITVKSITDGDTLTMALQNGEIDAAYGLPYASRALFENNDAYSVSSTATSRVYECAYNYDRPLMQDASIRKAISMSLDSGTFVKTLLDGYGETAVGPFPSNFKYAASSNDAVGYDLEAAKQLLASDGWKDTDGDGYLDKDGQILEISWVTYPSRQELPKLAEYAQAQLKSIGIKVDVNSTANHKQFVKADDFDVYASAIVAAPQGDPQYYFTTQYLPTSSYDAGHYSNDAVTANIAKLSTTFDASERYQLAKTIQKQVLSDNGYYYASFLQMAFVTSSHVSGMTAHPCDYYELTADLDITK